MAYLQGFLITPLSPERANDSRVRSTLKFLVQGVAYAAYVKVSRLVSADYRIRYRWGRDGLELADLRGCVISQQPVTQS